jgi:hypothetical protein
MKQWLLLGVMLMTMLSGVQAQDNMPAPSASEGAYIVNLMTEPENVDARKPFTLTVRILNADGKTPVTAFDEVHTKLLHFIIVTQDLTQFLHVHPDYQGDGVFVLKDLVLPEVANYVTYADFTPTSSHQQYVRNTLTVNGAMDKQPSLTVSPTEVTVGGLKIGLDASGAFKARTEISLKFHISDAQTGAAIDNLDEYLGAAGHLVIIDEPNQIYIHTHPAGTDMAGMSGMANMATATPQMAGMAMPMHYGPDLEFMTEFPHGGHWGLWLQVQYKGEVYTFSYVVDVTDNVEATPEATSQG